VLVAEIEGEGEKAGQGGCKLTLTRPEKLQAASSDRCRQAGIATGRSGAAGEDALYIPLGPAAVVLVFAEVTREDRDFRGDLVGFVEAMQELNQSPVIVSQGNAIILRHLLSDGFAPVVGVDQISMAIDCYDSSFDLHGEEGFQRAWRAYCLSGFNSHLSLLWRYKSVFDFSAFIGLKLAGNIRSIH
jgi:hypothetical protein